MLPPAVIKFRMCITGLDFLFEVIPYEVYVRASLKDHIDDVCSDRFDLLKCVNCATTPFTFLVIFLWYFRQVKVCQTCEQPPVRLFTFDAFVADVTRINRMFSNTTQLVFAGFVDDITTMSRLFSTSTQLTFYAFVADMI